MACLSIHCPKGLDCVSWSSITDETCMYLSWSVRHGPIQVQVVLPVVFCSTDFFVFSSFPLLLLPFLIFSFFPASFMFSTAFFVYLLPLLNILYSSYLNCVLVALSLSFFLFSSEIFLLTPFCYSFPFHSFFIDLLLPYLPLFELLFFLFS